MPSQAAAVVYGERAWGFLLLAQPRGTPADWIAVSGALLLGTARTLALLLQLERETRRRQELQQQWDEAADLLLLGEAASGLTHEINNCLNSILLQASVVQMRASPELREELSTIRHHGRQAAALLHPLQQARQRQRERAQPVDLNQSVREVVAAEPDGPRLFRLELAPGLLPVQARRDGVRALVRWLLHTAQSRQPPAAGPVSVRTWGDDARALLAVEDAGPAVPEPVAEHLFAEAEGLLDQPRLLERLAGQSLLHQFGATLQAQARAEGGVTLTVEWQ
jgi:signal transduction histidine kinase